jgi:LCP family protein required for cell wall assembly
VSYEGDEDATAIVNRPGGYAFLARYDRPDERGAHERDPDVHDPHDHEVDDGEVDDGEVDDRSGGAAPGPEWGTTAGADDAGRRGRQPTATMPTVEPSTSARSPAPQAPSSRPASTVIDIEAADGAHRTWGQRLLVGVGIIVVMACVAMVAFLGWNALQLNGIARKDVDLAAAGENEPQNWLVVGSDSRDVISRNDPNASVFTAGGENSIGQRSDTIMVVRIDPAGAVTILSLQRDLWLPIARTGKEERINTAYSYEDGPQRLVDTIQQDLDIEINHYVEINFESFRGIVDAVGGVPMYFDKPMRDNNSGLRIDNPGCVNLSGDQALAFARSRHLEYKDGKTWQTDPSADLGRISRQQYFMRRMFDAAAKQVKNPKTLTDLIGVANQYIGLDSKIDVAGAADMVRKFGGMGSGGIHSFSLPVRADMTPQGASVLMLEEAAAQPILNRFRGLAETDAVPAAVTFTVENGSGTPGQAQQVAEAFAAIGYRPGPTKDHAVVARTQVRYAPGSEAVADQLGRHLTAGAELVVDPLLPPGGLVIVTGSDFTTVMKRPRDPAPVVPVVPTVPTTVPGVTTTLAGSGRSTTTTRATTTTTTIPLNNTDTNQVGIVPGQAPPGVSCP